MRKRRRWLLVIVLLPSYLAAKYVPALINVLSKSKFLGILLGVDSSIGFALKDVSTIICWVIACIIGFDAHQKISKKMYGDFTGKSKMDFAIILSAFSINLFLLPITSFEPQFQIAHLNIPSPPIGVFMTVILLYVIIFSIILSKIIWRKSSLLQLTGPASQFWRTVGILEYEDAQKKYIRDTRISNTIIRKIQMLGWWYGPGLVLAAFFILYGLILWIITVSSLIFVTFVILWMIGRFRQPTPEEGIFNAVAATLRESHSKGLYGLILCIAAFLSCLLFILPIIFGLTQKKLPILAVLILPPFIYLFYFWYRQIKRLPIFVHKWMTRNKNYQEIEMPSLPYGDYKGFFSICILLSVWSISIKYYHSFSSFLFSSIPLSIMASLLIILSFKSKRKRVPEEQVIKENFKIILSLVGQLTCILFLNYVFLLDPNFLHKGIMVILVLVFIWFYPDWCKLLKRWYKTKSVKVILLWLGVVPIGFLPLLGMREKLVTILYWILTIFFIFLIIEEAMRVKIQSDQ